MRQSITSFEKHKFLFKLSFISSTNFEFFIFPVDLHKWTIFIITVYKEI